MANTPYYAKWSFRILTLWCAVVLCVWSKKSILSKSLGKKFGKLQRLRKFGTDLAEMQIYDEAKPCFATVYNSMEGQSGSDALSLRTKSGLELTQCLLNLNEYPEAIARCTEIISEMPSVTSSIEGVQTKKEKKNMRALSTAHYQRGLCLRELNMPLLALLDFRKALYCDPESDVAGDINEQINSIEIERREENTLDEAARDTTYDVNEDVPLDNIESIGADGTSENNTTEDTDRTEKVTAEGTSISTTTDTSTTDTTDSTSVTDEMDDADLSTEDQLEDVVETYMLNYPSASLSEEGISEVLEIYDSRRKIAKQSKGSSGDVMSSMFGNNNGVSGTGGGGLSSLLTSGAGGAGGAGLVSVALSLLQNIKPEQMRKAMEIGQAFLSVGKGVKGMYKFARNNQMSLLASLSVFWILSSVLV